MIFDQKRRTLPTGINSSRDELANKMQASVYACKDKLQHDTTMAMQMI